MIDWQTIRSELEWDGSLRDLYVHGTSVQDWNRFLDALRAWPYQTAFSVNGEPAALPDSASEVFATRPRGNPLLHIDLGGIGLCCHFFTDEELELDLDPRELDGPPRLDQLVEFMRRPGRELRRPVLLTPENYPQSPIIRYDPDSDTA